VQKEFETSFKKMISNNEKESLNYIRNYQNEKKLLTRYIEEQNADDKIQRIQNILQKLHENEAYLVKKEIVLN